MKFNNCSGKTLTFSISLSGLLLLQIDLSEDSSFRVLSVVMDTGWVVYDTGLRQYHTSKAKNKETLPKVFL